MQNVVAKAYYDANDIKNLCVVSKSRAYQIIKQLNDELKDMGYIVPKAGYVSRRYAEKRLMLDKKAGVL